MTGSGFATMFVVVLLIHVSIIVYTWIEKRCKPILVKLDLFESEVETLHAIAAEYLQMGVAVPGHCIVSPQSAIVTEAKRIETRLMIELVAIGCAGFIPPGLIALLINMIH
tara:strand:+ start:1101 stop:1433 length:333 start_codon:yes stop_codon:yes gene_type:complete